MTALATGVYYDEIGSSFDESGTASRTIYSNVVNYGWQVETLKRLQQLRNLPQNWNSYGSIPPTHTVLNLVRKLLFDFLGNRDMPTPDLSPVHGGGIQIEWHKGGRELELEVFPDSHFEFLKMKGDEILEEGLASPSKIYSLISWVLQD